MEIQPHILLAQMGIFIAVIFAIKFLYVEPVLRILKKRDSLTSGRAAEATSMKEKILTLQEEIDSKMSELRDVLDHERKEASRIVRERCDARIQDTKLQVERKLNQEYRSLDQEIIKIRQQIPETSVQIGKEILNALMDSKVVRA